MIEEACFPRCGMSQLTVARVYRTQLAQRFLLPSINGKTLTPSVYQSIVNQFRETFGADRAGHAFMVLFVPELSDFRKAIRQESEMMHKVPGGCHGAGRQGRCFGGTGAASMQGKSRSLCVDHEDACIAAQTPCGGRRRRTSPHFPVLEDTCVTHDDTAMSASYLDQTQPRRSKRTRTIARGCNDFYGMP